MPAQIGSMQPGRDSADALARLWNRCMREVHGFFPLTARIFERRVLACPRFKPRNLLLARVGGEIVGMLHCDQVHTPFFDKAGVVEMVCVAPEWRRRGIGSRLLKQGMRSLREQGELLVDGCGSWPYSPFYTTLIEGSERSGVWLQDAAVLRLFERAGFLRGRESLVMRLDPARVAGAPVAGRVREEGLVVQESERAGDADWLDFVFRGWRLREHRLLDTRGNLLSRAIYCRMEGESSFRGRECYALFGVNTPRRYRGRGYAGINLRLLAESLAVAGVHTLELHVYADNIPALALYRRLGFQEVGRTVAMRWSA